MKRLAFPFFAIIFSLLIAVLVGSGCAQPPEELPTPEPTATPEEQAQLPTPEPSATPMPTPTPRPTSTPLPAGLIINYQIVQRDGMLTIEELTIPEDGWLVVYPDRRGQLIAGDALGFAPVSAGQQSGVMVAINPQWPEQTVQIALHGGRTGEDDSLLTASADNLLLIQTVQIDTLATLPEIEAADQEVMDDGIVNIGRVSIRQPGWLAVYPADDVERVHLLGYVPLPAGESEAVAVPIRWREAPDTLRAVVLQDLGGVGVFEPAVDQPFKILEDDLQAEIAVTYPPDIVIFNQPVIDGRFAVERAATPVDGWLVVYEDGDEDNQPGFIIGSAAIKKGVNENFYVEVNSTAVVDQLLVTFHEDTGDLGVFDFPGDDQPQRYQEQAFFTVFRTDQGSTLMTVDQSLVDSRAVIPLVIVEFDSWVVLYADDGGQPGSERLGFAWVPAGLNRDVAVDLPEDPPTRIVHAVLHADNGTIEAFEPEQTDFPLQSNRRLVTARFELGP